MFELPLLNTVNHASFSDIWEIIAVWVRVSLYGQNLTFNYTYLEILGQILIMLLISFLDTSILVLCTNSDLSLWISHQNNSNDHLITENSKGLDEFYKWFVGFSDAEGMFNITQILNKGKVEGFSFRFKIGLHKDDFNVLHYIKSKLDMGSIYASNDSQILTISKKDDISKLISIFDSYTLNTSKYLDYLAFKRAFILYTNRKNFTDKLIAQIIDLKNDMNYNREDYNMVIDHEIVITKSWLLGLIEGDGSFSLERNTMEPVFSIKLTETQLPVLTRIKQYLENNLDLDFYSIHKLKSTQIIKINSEKARGNSKPLVSLVIKNVHFLNNYLVPFFDEEIFITKKGLDFSDFKIICNAIYIGAHRKEIIKSLIFKISYTMNNFRLSTYSGSVESLSEEEINLLINAMPSIKHLKDGRQIDIDTNKIIRNRSSSSVYEIIQPSGEVLVTPNLAKAAEFINVGFNTLQRRLDVEDLEDSVELKGYKIKRLGVFKPKS